MWSSVLTSARMVCLKNTRNSNISSEGEEWCMLCLKHIRKHINWKTVTQRIQLFPIIIRRVDLALSKTG